MYSNGGIRSADARRKVTSRNEKNKTCENTIYQTNGYQQLLRGDSDEVDLESLLQVVNGISDILNENEVKTSKKRSRICKDKFNKTCVETAVFRYKEGSFRGESTIEQAESTPSRASTASSRRTRSSRMSQSFRMPSSRKNMSFTNESVREIDLENQRLLREIIQKKPTAKNKGVKQRPSSSSINRLRRQQQIEKENMQFLQKLQSVKPTKTISRDYLLADHQRILERSNRKTKSSKQRRKSLPHNSNNGGIYSDGFDEDDGSAGSVTISNKSIKSPRPTSSGRKQEKVWEPGW